MATETMNLGVQINTAPLQDFLERLGEVNIPPDLQHDFPQWLTSVDEEIIRGCDGMIYVNVTVKPSHAALEYAGKVWLKNGG